MADRSASRPATSSPCAIPSRLRTALARTSTSPDRPGAPRRCAVKDSIRSLEGPTSKPRSSIGLKPRFSGEASVWFHRCATASLASGCLDVLGHPPPASTPPQASSLRAVTPSAPVGVFDAASAFAASSWIRLATRIGFLSLKPWHSLRFDGCGQFRVSYACAFRWAPTSSSGKLGP